MSNLVTMNIWNSNPFLQTKGWLDSSDSTACLPNSFFKPSDCSQCLGKIQAPSHGPQGPAWIRPLHLCSPHSSPQPHPLLLLFPYQSISLKCFPRQSLTLPQTQVLCPCRSCHWLPIQIIAPTPLSSRFQLVINGTYFNIQFLVSTVHIHPQLHFVSFQADN